MKNLQSLLIYLLILFTGNTFAQSNPQLLDSSININRIMTIKDGAIRLAKDPVTHNIYYVLTTGEIYQVIQPPVGPAYDSLVFDTLDHGVQYVQGFAIHDSTMYVSGNNYSNTPLTYGIIVRGKLQPNGTRVWDTLMHTQDYKTGDYFDHLFSGLVVNPAGDTIYICSGARGDHGEIQTRYGLYPGVRNEPLTTLIFAMPTHNPATITLPNDSALLDASGYIFCRGVRNHFDMAFDSNGNLFGLENSGDRDHNEEMNWLKRGHHYGFPWRMGDTDNPQQFSWFNPNTDKLINHYTRSWRNNFWSNDPTFPPPPGGVVFDEPIQNFGPDCDKFRDTTGAVHDASDSGISIGTFTAHRSPLGLVFDNAHILASPFNGDAFMLSWTQGYDSCGCTVVPDTGVGPFVDPSQDLVHLHLTFDSIAGNFSLHATRIIGEFSHPVDADIDSNKIYVLENGYGSTPGLYEVILPGIVPPLPCNPLLSVNTPDICRPDSNSVSIPAFGSLPDLISWYNSSGILIQADSGVTANDTISMLSSGDYYVVISDSGTCGTDTLLFSIREDITFQIDSVANTSCIGCNNGVLTYSTNLSPSASSVTINPSAGVHAGNSFINLPPDHYIICISDTNLCIKCDSAVVLDDPTMISSIIDERNFVLFPNPVNNTSTLQFNGEGNFKIRLFDVSGKELMSLLDENLKKGLHELTINSSGLPDGSYSIEISNGKFTSHKKMVIIR